MSPTDGKISPKSARDACPAPSEFHYSRRTSLLYLAASIVIAGLVEVRVSALGSGPATWLLPLLMVPASGFAWLVIRPRRLVIDDQGFRIHGGFAFRPKRILWQELESVTVCHPGRGSRAVGVNFKRPRRDPLHLADEAPSARPMLILQGWDEPPETMADALEAARRESAGEATR